VPVSHYWQTNFAPMVAYRSHNLKRHGQRAAAVFE
jgi:hypothetical protein